MVCVCECEYVCVYERERVRGGMPRMMLETCESACERMEMWVRVCGRINVPVCEGVCVCERERVCV